MKIIVRVRELRKDQNLTQEELARQLKISRQSLISLEQGRWLPSLPLAVQLAQFFNVPLEDVISAMPAQVVHRELPALPVFPTINVRQDEANIYLEVHVPGFTQDQIDIEVADEYITIAGNAETENDSDETSNNDYLRREFHRQSFSRTVGLPTPIKKDEAQARMAHGILGIILPKETNSKPPNNAHKADGRLTSILISTSVSVKVSLMDL